MSYGVPPKSARPSSSKSAQFGKARVLNNVRFDKKEHIWLKIKIINAEHALVKIARRRRVLNDASNIYLTRNKAIRQTQPRGKKLTRFYPE